MCRMDNASKKSKMMNKASYKGYKILDKMFLRLPPKERMETIKAICQRVVDISEVEFKDYVDKLVTKAEEDYVRDFDKPKPQTSPVSSYRPFCCGVEMDLKMKQEPGDYQVYQCCICTKMQDNK